MRDKTVAILESRLGEHLAEMVRKQGGIPLPAPALAEVPEIDLQRIADLLSDLQAQPARLFIFQTGVGTRALFEAADKLDKAETLKALLDRSQVAARGPKPTAVLRGRGVRIDFSAADPFTTTELLAAIGGVALEGERVVVQRYGDRNVELEQALQRRGARVIEVPTYRWALPRDIGPLVDLIQRLERSAVDAVVFTSASQVHHLFEVARMKGKSDALKNGLRRTLIASIGPVCSRALGEFGMQAGFEASPPKLGPLVSGLTRALKGKDEG